MAAHPRIIEGDAAAKGVRMAIVAARFNAFVVDKLVNGALQALTEAGVRAANVDVVRVPGAFELPLAVKQAAASRRYAAIIALGAVIRGETPHFDYVAGECARGVMQVMLETGVPVGFGVLTCETLEQAQARAGGEAGNKGADATRAALEMAGLLQRLAN